MSLCARLVSASHSAQPPVFEGLSLEIPSGQLIGLTGDSGSGKTTLARIMALLQAPNDGYLTFDNVPVSTNLRVANRKLGGAVGMLFQSPRSATDPRMTLAKIIAQPGKIAGRPIDVAGLACRVGLTSDLLARFPHQVSNGQLQRACIARVLAQRPRYLICDEPTSMFDAATTAHIIRTVEQCVAEEGIGTLMISHHLPTLEACCTTIHSLRMLTR